MSSFISPSAQVMAVPRDPTDAEIARFISTRDTPQMMKLVQGIQGPASQAVFTASVLLLPPATSGRSTTPEKAKKALNAFVGFRSYYIKIPDFKQWPMMKLSALLALLWESDPNKPLWSLMAKAWSCIRDCIGKDRAPLDGFFGIVCLFLKMPTPSMYLELYGWTLTTNQEGGPKLSRDDKIQLVSVSAARRPISVEDIIAYAQMNGYAQGFVVDPNTFNPTFLATGNHGLPQVPRVPVDTRLLARNKRRAKRQTAIETGSPYLLSLQQDLANAHAFQDQLRKDNGFFAADLPTVADLSVAADIPVAADLPMTEDHPLYQSFAKSFTGNDFQGNLSDDFTFEDDEDIEDVEDTDIAAYEDGTAFRLGADADATLPTFDGNNF